MRGFSKRTDNKIPAIKPQLCSAGSYKLIPSLHWVCSYFGLHSPARARMTSKVNGDGQFNPVIPSLPLPLASPLPAPHNLERITLPFLLRKPGALVESASSIARKHRDKYK
jgi:hypothetical protein